MMTQVIDNFLSEEEFKPIQDYLMGSDVYWRLTHVLTENLSCDDSDNIQFFHPFYGDHEPKGEDINLLAPIINKLDIKSLVRIKANLTLRTPTIIEHGYHTDFPFDGFKTAVFYVNTNDGYTIIKDGRRVDSVENRLFEFTGTLEHTGTTCTDSRYRVVINFDYF